MRGFRYYDVCKQIFVTKQAGEIILEDEHGVDPTNPIIVDSDDEDDAVGHGNEDHGNGVV